MTEYILKSALVSEIERRQKEEVSYSENGSFASLADENHYFTLEAIKSFINTLEVKDPYEQCVQYPSIEDGIKAHAEVYSFNIESELFNQLTKEQQALWRKEIEEACISGGYVGYQLAKVPRYKKNLEVKEVDLDEDVDRILEEFDWNYGKIDFYEFAKHFFELGLQGSNTLTWEDISNIDDLLDESLPSSFGDELELKGYYEEVLRRFKAQKGK